MPKKKKTLQQLETVYVHGSDSYRKLAEKYGVPFKTLSCYAKRNNWPEKRRQFRDKVRATADRKEIQRQANKLLDIGTAADKLVDEINAALSDPMQFKRRVIITAEGIEEKEVQTYNVGAIKQFTGALKTLADVIRDVYNLPKEEKPKEQVELVLKLPEGAEDFAN